MVTCNNVTIPDSKALEKLCRRYRVRGLALFGSVLRDDFRDDSDVDILVEFEPGSGIGRVEYVRLQRELGEMFGRRVDLVEEAGLKTLIQPVRHRLGQCALCGQMRCIFATSWTRLTPLSPW